MLGIYLRLSKKDDDNNSIENQLKQASIYKSELSEYIDNFKIYNEGEGKSGTLDDTKRPELKKLTDDIEAGIITSVWMRKQDRLARSGKVALKFADTIKDNNVYLFFGDKGHCDLNDYMVYFQFGIMAMVDELKPKAQSEETIKSLKRNAEEGKVNGPLPFGYATDDNSIPYKIDKEAKIINEIFDKYLKGEGTGVIANYLNKNKIATKSNKKAIWECATVKNVLKCQWYVGKRLYQKIEYNVPTIVDEVKFEKTQKAIEIRKSQRFGDKTKYDYLLRGIIKCHKCSRNYIGRTRPAKLESYYQCSSKRSKYTNCGNGSLNIRKLDTFILKHLFHSKDFINRLEAIQNSNSVVNQLKIDIETIERKHIKAEAKVVRYAKLVGDDYNEDKYILKEYDNAKNQLSKLELALRKAKIQYFDATNTEGLVKYKEIYNEFNIDADFETIKSAVHSIIESVTIESNKDVSDKLYFLVKIIYKGFNDSSMFAVKRPYEKWLCLNETRSTPTPEEIQDDIDALEFAYGDKKPKGKVFTEDDVKQDFYTERNLEPITVDKSELIDFNKQPRIV